MTEPLQTQTPEAPSGEALPAVETAKETAHTVSVVIPAYNEETGLKKIVPRLRELAEVAEVIVVDDGSTDDTARIAAEAGARVLRQPYNKGYGASLKRGIREATSEIIVIMDSDGQHDPQDIERLTESMDQYEMVVGERTRQSRGPLLRQPGKWLMKWTAEYLMGQRIPDLNSGFRAFRRQQAMEFMHILPNGFSFTTTITLALMKAGYSVGYVPIDVPARVGRKSSVSFFRDGLQTLLLITRAVSLFNPLKVFIPPSIFLLVVGGLYGLWGVWVAMSIPTGSMLAILAGLVILFFGILSDQVSIIVRERR